MLRSVIRIASPLREGTGMNNEGRPSSDETGTLLAHFAPQGVGIRESFTPVNASWPFPRALEIYENGILAVALGTTAWIPRASIQSLHRGAGYIRIKWELGGGTSSATVSSWFNIGRVHRALEQFGFPIRRS